MNFRNLLVNLGLVVGNAAAKWDPSGIAGLLLEAYGKHRDKNQLRGELEALMRASFQQFRDQLQDAMGDHRLQLAEGVRRQVEAYLSQFQASARQAARLLGDPSATTVPATVGVDDPQQLAAFLPQHPPRFTVGDVVPGLPSWTLVEPLGVGGFGEVWKARHADDENYAAFKFFLDPTARSRFTAAEARVLKEIHQKAPTDGVVKLLQAEARQDPPWLQFEYIAGGDLSRLPETWTKLPPAERVKRVQEVVRTLAATVGHFHNLGVVHRDLKPSNVLLRPDRSLVVADFGISRILPAGAGTAPTPTNSALATIRAYTPAYASPQHKKFLLADRRDDVYALAVLWYQLLRNDLSLERPGGDGWKETLARLGVSEASVKLLNRCWDDDPDVRPKDGNELAARLGAERPVMQPIPLTELTPAPQPQPEPKQPRKAREGSWVVGLAIAAGLFVVILVVGVKLVSRRDIPPPSIATTPPPLSQGPLTFKTTPSPLSDRPPSNATIPSPFGRLVTNPRDPNLKAGDVYSLSVGSPAVAMRFRWCPPGSFMMGSNQDNSEKPIHKVTFAKGLWMAETETTQAQCQAVMKDKPNPSYFKGDDLPVEQVSALEADAFAEAVKKATGMPVRLPSEAEWEYACRAGTSTDYATGNGEEALKKTGWYDSNSGNKTHPVGKLAANPWGLFDMHGNVWEWCADGYGPYQSGDQIDPHVQSNEFRVLRGGGWFSGSAFCRAAFRYRGVPGYRYGFCGFRCVFRLD